VHKGAIKRLLSPERYLAVAFPLYQKLIGDDMNFSPYYVNETLNLRTDEKRYKC
jgi:hypothetical protein